MWTEQQIEFIQELRDKDELTWAEIAERFPMVFGEEKTPNAMRKAYYRHLYPILDKSKQENAPKILILDIETAPMLGYVWSLWNNNVGLNQLYSDWYVLSWAAKWYKSEEVMYEDQREAKNIEDDKQLLQKIWKLLDEADIVITQNGKSFDIKRLFARFIIHGMQPPSTFRNIDTKLIAKRHFGFPSNKLEYMTDKLCKKYKKLKHGNFPGFELWTECIKGNPEAWDEMEEYNIHDILSLEELYEIMIPWDDSINFGIYYEEETCSCGCTEFKENGYYYTNASKYRKYKCEKCGKEYRDKKNLKNTNKRLVNRRG